MTMGGRWAGRRVFLTGHTGFKGSWLAMTLSRLGAGIYGYSLPAAAQGLYRTCDVGSLMTNSIEADIRSADRLAQAVADSGAEIVIHMAAQSLVRLSYSQPVETYETNVMGTVHLLEAVRRATGVRSCVIVTSDKCYENREWDWGYRESEPMGGFDPYSNSKGCAELVTSAYRRSFLSSQDTARVASGRAGNVIGGGDWSADRLIPDLMAFFAAGEAALIRSPNAVRPWQHVLDPLFGYLTLADQLLTNPAEEIAAGWNFGPDASSERSVGEVVAEAARLWGSAANWKMNQIEQPHEASVLKLDSSRAKRLLNWQPIWPFERALEETVNWYRAAEAGEDMTKFTWNQIDTYIGDRSTMLGERA